MALINFQIEVDTSPDAPSPVTLDAGIVEDLSPFDRLQFTAMDQSGNPASGIRQPGGKSGRFGEVPAGADFYPQRSVRRGWGLSSGCYA